MAPSTAAPATHSQPSRKGKRAWRKNVDLTALEADLSTAREEAILTGGKPLDAIDASALFQTDSSGSVAIRDAVRKQHKPLRSDEILAARSAVPAIDTHKRPSGTTDGIVAPKAKRQRISRSEVERLKQLAYSSNIVHTDALQETESATHDPWAVVPAVPPTTTTNFLPKTKPVRAPRTLVEPPISLAASGKPIPHVPVPNAGRSYNPSFAAWSALLEREGAKEVAAETRRRAFAAAEAETLARAAEIAAQPSDDDDAATDAYDSEWSGIASEPEPTRRRPVRKTPAERNKATRRKAAAAQTRHEARMRRRQEKLDASIAGLSRGPTEPAPLDSDSDAENPRLRRRGLRAGGAQLFAATAAGERRSAVPKAPLAVVLPDELQGSLRRLKPEGNALEERWRSKVVQGRMEGRVRPVGVKRARREKVTEKWSYKDWRLDGRRVVGVGS